METAPLVLDARGRWFDTGVEIVHRGIQALLDASIAAADGGGFEVAAEGTRRKVDVEDAPLFVSSVREERCCVVMSVRNRGEEPLDPGTLGTDERGFTAVLKCGLRARFLRPAYVDLAQGVFEDSGGLFIRLPGGRILPLKTQK